MTDTTVLVRTYIIRYSDKTRCISFLGLDLDKGLVLVWQHHAIDDEGTEIADSGYRTMDPIGIEVYDYGIDPLPVPLSAISGRHTP